MKETKISEGITQITFTKDEMDEMMASIASQHGMTLEQYRAALKKDADENWCQCETPDEDNVIFCDDGQRINKHCCSKHHYHCGRCGKITQVG